MYIKSRSKNSVRGMCLSMCCCFLCVVLSLLIYIFFGEVPHSHQPLFGWGKKNSFGLVEVLKRNVWPEEALSNIELNIIS